MKKILLSLLVIAGVSAFAVGATQAFFSDIEAVSGNTFSTGTVSLGTMTGLPITLTNLAPGDIRVITLTIPYNGSLLADLYVGAGGNDNSNDFYLADEITVEIDRYMGGDTYTPLLNQKGDYLSTHWVNLAEDVLGNTTYRVTFTVDEDIPNDHQGRLNENTVYYILALEKDTAPPAWLPYQTTGTQINELKAPAHVN